MHELDPERWPAGQADTAGLTCKQPGWKEYWWLLFEDG